MGKKVATKPKASAPQTPQVDIRKEAVIKSLSSGDVTVTKACEAAGIDRKTFYNWLKADKDFALRIAHSEQAAIATVEDALWANAVRGNTTAQIFYLCNRKGDRWKNVNKVDYSGSVDLKLGIEAIREAGKSVATKDKMIETNPALSGAIQVNE